MSCGNNHFIKYLFSIVIFFISHTIFAQIGPGDEEPVFTVVDEMPSFPGGEIEMSKFLNSNLKYPESEKEAHITGKCFLTFIVEKDGHLNDIKLLRGITGGPGCDEEAIRVVKLMPAWNPGKQNGAAVRVQFNLPIKFTLLSTDPEILNDTIYFNSLWMECSNESAEFYRIISRRYDGYLVEDFYMKTKTPQMIAVCNEIKPLLKKNGHCINFFETGQKSSEGEYIKDKMVGRWILWEENNTDSTIIECFSEGTYKNIYLSKSRITLYDKYDVFYKIEEPASFPGGEDAMGKWIARWIDGKGYPEKEKRDGITGTCYVTFVIEKDGKITDIDLLKGIPNGEGYNKLVIELVSEMPLWKPGKQYGRPVRVHFNLPVRFVMR